MASAALRSLNVYMSKAAAHNAESIRRRHVMVERQIAHRGISSPRVLDAMRRVEREVFLPQELRKFAYDHTPLAIEAGQTIAQPYPRWFTPPAPARCRWRQRRPPSWGW